MKEIHQTITIDAKIKTTLENMNKTVSQLQDGLNKGVTNLDMSKGIGNSLSKTINSFKDEFNKFSNLTKSGNLELIDSKKAIQSGEKIIEKYREIQRIAGNFNDLKIGDAKKLFPDAFKTEINDFQNKLQTLKQNMNNLEIKGIEVSQAEARLTALNTQADELKKKLIDETQLTINADQANQNLESAVKKVEELRNALKNDLKLKLDAADLESGRINSEIKKIEADRSKRDTSDLAVGSGGHVTYQGKTSKQWEKSGASKEQIAAAQQAIQAFAAEEKQLNKLRGALTSVEKDAAKLRTAFAGFGEKTDLVKTAQLLGKSSSEIDQTKVALENQAQAANQAKLAQESLTDAQTKNATTRKNIETNTNAIAEQEQKVAKLRLQYDSLFGKIDVSKLEQGLQKTLGKDFTPELLRTKEGVEQVLQKLRETDQADLEVLKNNLVQMGVSADQAEDYIKQLRDGLVQIKDTGDGIRKTASDMDMLKNRFLYFFSLTNSVQLFRRTVTKALNTVKELDKTMTQAAVVTNFDIGDMWEKLPQYSKQAQDLGVSINGMYEATTLYYQQGLKTNAAMALGVETMKMAKIAAIDSEEATKAMTAALRGFNMELNETSAVRVNDVYSQLAAVTAADTGQIATAMEKTASIAASANMEFETTAAFLAQIIETTQEAPETAGTALKTIIARFAEVKSLRDQGLSAGKDEEGEDIDVNKIQTALRSVGISMDGFFAGTEGLDSVLMKLAEKWNSLDFETQRYVATMAAGSRQQSRFIAMMSDYSRTVELVDKAHNSSGASQRQFEKTLESMESKLQRLKNAWEQFTMGLANNEILKGAVDLLTEVLEGVNKLTNGLSGGNGLVKSIVSLGVAIGGLKAGKSLINLLFGGAASKMAGKLGGALGLPGAGEKSQQPTGVPVGQEIGFKESWSKAGRAIKGKASGFVGTLKTPFVRQSKLDLAARNDNQAKFKSFMAKTEQGLGEDDLSTKAVGIRKINEQVADGQIGLEEAAEGYKKLGVNLDEAGIKTELLGNKMESTQSSNQRFVQGAQQTSQALKSASSAMFTAGAACAGLSALLSAMGFDEAAEKVGKLSGILMGVGAVLMALGPIASGVGKVVATAGITAQAAWGWIGLILGVIALLITAIVLLSKKNAGVAEQIEATNKQIEQMADASKKAAEAIDNITSTREDLEKMADTFDGLVKGTTEWKRALIESNNKVLELLNLYPQLSDNIVFNKDGVMEIETAGWNEILEYQTEVMAKTQAISMGLQVKKASLEQVQLQEDYEKGNLTWSQYTIKKNSAQVQQELLLDNYANSLIQQNDYLSNSEYGKNAAAAYSFGNSPQEFSKEVLSQTVDTSKSGEKDLVNQYADLVGEQSSAIQEQLDNGDLTKEDMAAAIQLNKATQKAVQQMESLARQISGINNEEDQALITKILSKNGEDLTNSDIGNLKQIFVDEGWNNGELTGEAIKNYFEKNSIEINQNQIDGILEALKNVEEAYNTNFNSRLSEYGFASDSQVSQFINGLDYGSANALMGKIGVLKGRGVANEDIAALIMQIQELVGSLGEGELATFLKGDWTSKEGIEDEINYLQSLSGADIPGLSSLENSIIQLTGAVTKNTQAQLQDKKYQLAEYIRQINSGELNPEAITEEQAKAINTLLGGEFTKNFKKIGLDKYQYSGEGGSLYTALYNKDAQDQSDKEDSYKKAEKDVGTSKDFVLKFKTDAETVAGINYQTSKTLTEGELKGVEEAGRREYILTNYGQTAAEKYDSAIYYYDMAVSYGYTPENKEQYIMGQMGTITNNIDPNTVAEWQRQIDATYTAMASFLGETPDSSLSYSQKQAKIAEWYATWSKTTEFENAFNTAKSARASEVQTNTDAYTTDIGWSNISDPTESSKYRAERTNALKKRLASTGAQGYLNDLQTSLQKTGISVSEFDLTIMALASDLAIAETKTKTLAENMAALSSDLGKNKNSPEYQKALNAAKTNVANYFGVSLDELETAGIADSFYVSLANGDSSVLTDMGKKIAESTIQNLDMTKLSSYIKTSMTEQDIVDLYKQLGGDETKLGDMNYVVSEVGKKLGLLGYRFAGELDASTSKWKGITTKYSPSELYTNYYEGSSSKGWENNYDKSYNDVKKINALLKEREKLEREYGRLLERNGATADKIVESQKKQLSNYTTEKTKRTALLADRKTQMDELQSENSDLLKYAWYDEDLGQVQINWSELEKLDGSTDDGLTGKVEDFISKLEDQSGLIEQEQDKLEEINDGVWEIYNKGKDEYFNLETLIKDSIIANEQENIDKLTAIDESINETNSQILGAMQEQISEDRQNRQNDKTEQELIEKQRQLSYLQQDSSNANSLEILKLKKEIDQAQEDYTDTLIDQKISELQKQNDEAAEQRQKQISILQAQLDQYSKSEEIWKKVQELMDGGIDSGSGLITGSELEKLLKSDAGWDAMSKLEQMDWMNETNTSIAEAVAWLKTGAMQSLFGQGNTVEFTTADGKVVSGVINEDGNVETEYGVFDGKTFEMDSKGNVTSSVALSSLTQPTPAPEPEKTGSGNIASLPGQVNLSPEQIKKLQTGLNELIDHGQLSAKKITVNGSYDSATKEGVKALQAKIGATADGIWGPSTQKKFKNSPLKAYNSGGLADFTGPAWLDGTKAKPEYVLSADQTKAFFNLVDVLSAFKNGSMQNTQNNGEYNYDIDINVEKIDNESDLEMISRKIEEMIIESARYRNINTL